MRIPVPLVERVILHEPGRGALNSSRLRMTAQRNVAGKYYTLRSAAPSPAVGGVTSSRDRRLFRQTGSTLRAHQFPANIIKKDRMAQRTVCLIVKIRDNPEAFRIPDAGASSGISLFRGSPWRPNMCNLLLSFLSSQHPNARQNGSQALTSAWRRLTSPQSRAKPGLRWAFWMKSVPIVSH